MKKPIAKEYSFRIAVSLLIGGLISDDTDCIEMSDVVEILRDIANQYDYEHKTLTEEICKQQKI